MKKFLSLAFLSASFLLAANFSGRIEAKAKQMGKDLENVSQAYTTQTMSVFGLPEAEQPNKNMTAALQNRKKDTDTLATLNLMMQKRNEHLAEQTVPTIRNAKFFAKQIEELSAKKDKLSAQLDDLTQKDRSGRDANLLREKLAIAVAIEAIEAEIVDYMEKHERETQRVKKREVEFEQLEHIQLENAKQIKQTTETNLRMRKIQAETAEKKNKTTFIDNVTTIVSDAMFVHFDLTETPMYLDAFDRCYNSCVKMLEVISPNDKATAFKRIEVDVHNKLSNYQNGATELKEILKAKISDRNRTIYEILQKKIDNTIDAEMLFYEFFATTELSADDMVATYTGFFGQYPFSVAEAKEYRVVDNKKPVEKKEPELSGETLFKKIKHKIGNVERKHEAYKEEDWELGPEDSISGVGRNSEVRSAVSSTIEQSLKNLANARRR